MSALLDTRRLHAAGGFEWLPVAAALLILYVPTFYDLARTLWRDDDFAHGPIILAVVVWLAWDRRQVLLLAASTRAAPVWGLALLACGLLVYVVGRSLEIAILEVGALCPILAGVLLAMRGWPALRALWFTLLFTAYLVPLPGFFVDAVTLPLKQTVSTAAGRMLHAAGYPIAQDGVILHIGQYHLLVADACSGLNTMFSLTALGLLYLYLVKSESWLRNGLILVSLLPIAFFSNIVRVVILALVTYHFGDAAGQGFVHGFSGMVLFVAAFIAILAFDAVLVRVTKPARAAS